MAASAAKDREERPAALREWLVLLLRDLAVVGLVFGIAFGALFAYSQVWPPMVVVESSSMQHSDTESFVGVIDTGDYVVVQSAPLRGQVVTWVEGRAQGYRTYSDFGDVIVFWPPVPSTRPIIHRAILWLEWNTTTNAGWDAPSLLGLPRSEWTAFDRNGSLEFPFNIDSSITLRHTGFRGDLSHDIPVFPPPSSRRGERHYVTMGDNNAYSGGPDPWIVPHGNVVGNSRGELPWFGLLKLTFAPEDFCCRGWGDPRAPRNSWDALTVSLIVIIAVPFAADFGISWWQKRRKAAAGGRSATDDGEAAAARDPSIANRLRGWLRRRFRRSD